MGKHDDRGSSVAPTSSQASTPPGESVNAVAHELERGCCKHNRLLTRQSGLLASAGDVCEPIGCVTVSPMSSQPMPSFQIAGSWATPNLFDRRSWVFGPASVRVSDWPASPDREKWVLWSGRRTNIREWSALLISGRWEGTRGPRRSRHRGTMGACGGLASDQPRVARIRSTLPACLTTPPPQTRRPIGTT